MVENESCGFLSGCGSSPAAATLTSMCEVKAEQEKGWSKRKDYQTGREKVILREWSAAFCTGRL